MSTEIKGKFDLARGETIRNSNKTAGKHRRHLVLKEHSVEETTALTTTPPPADSRPQDIDSSGEDTPRLKEFGASRQSLFAALEEMEARVLNRTTELEAANQALQAERALLERKNTALKELLDQIDEHKRQSGQQLQSNINRVIRPMLQILSDRLPPDEHHLIKLLDSTLKDLMDPFVGKVDQLTPDLTRREMEVCTMIRNGFTSKQIASVLKTSIFTVHNQRRGIRRKLHIDDGHTNLESYLKSL